MKQCIGIFVVRTLRQDQTQPPLGLSPTSSAERRDLLKVVEDRHGLSSTVVVTQLPIDRWHKNIKEAAIADAILDRLVHNAHKINLKGDCMRKLRSILIKNRDSEK